MVQKISHHTRIKNREKERIGYVQIWKHTAKNCGSIARGIFSIDRIFFWLIQNYAWVQQKVRFTGSFIFFNFFHRNMFSLTNIQMLYELPDVYTSLICPSFENLAWLFYRSKKWQFFCYTFHLSSLPFQTWATTYI